MELFLILLVACILFFGWDATLGMAGGLFLIIFSIALGAIVFFGLGLLIFAAHAV